MLALALALAPTAYATTLSLLAEEELEPGVTIEQYRASSPSTDVWVLRVDLCADGVYLDATRAPDATATPGSWGAEVAATAAVNGDFYKTDPLRVYGDAYGGGVRWPSGQTGWDSRYEDEWYWEHYGWIAVLHDSVEFSHTAWVKDNVSGLLAGWDNTDPTPAPPAGVVAMVSGFPELVVEGTPMVCADPEADDCFPDRTDMRDRHPRTAIGLTEDRGTLMLVVADGRTSDNAGLYGSELADILGQLGAWEAFNLDGGGSSQLWTDAEGYVNDFDGNNSGSGNRGVANHWGVFAGGRDWLADRPGHCSTAPSCGAVPPAGRIIDETDPCFGSYGRRQYWRSATEGYGGSLLWTNAWESDRPDNWAWWRVEPEEEGDYEVSVYVEPTWSVFDDVEYAVMADGDETRLRMDPTAVAGWMSLGTFHFAAGGGQWVAVYDDQDTDPGTDQHIASDAVQVVRVGEWCGDGVCADAERCVCDDCLLGEEEPGNGVDDDCDGLVDELAPTTDDTGTGDTAPTDSNEPVGDTAAAQVLGGKDPAACGCGGATASWGAALVAGALAGGTRRRPRA